MTHVGSGVDKEVNHALELLSSLLDADLKAMTRFTVIIKVFLCLGRWNPRGIH